MKLILWIFFLYFMKNFALCQDQAEEEVNVVQNITAAVPNGILNLDEIDWPLHWRFRLKPSLQQVIAIHIFFVPHSAIISTIYLYLV